MSVKTEVLYGKAEWLLRRADKFNKYRFNFYPKDAAERKKVKELGLRNKLNEGNEDFGGFYYKLQSAEGGSQPWMIFDENGAVFEGAIGHGTEIAVHLDIETFESPAHGEVTRSSVSKIVLTKLVPYVKPEATATTSELPV